MAAPFNLEDLAKLKSFVGFVDANPAVLNMPQLDFFKKLIEKFGGKIPEGEFEMPAGAKCPFGGNMKSENKCNSNTTSSTADDVDDEIPEMGTESEESEIELDMEANNSQPLLEPNVIYLEDKPPKIIKKSAKSRKTSKKGGVKKKAIIKKRKSSNQIKRSQLEHLTLSGVKREYDLIADEVVEKIENTDPNDPLYTPKVEVKCELAENEIVNFSGDEDLDAGKEYKNETVDDYGCEDDNDCEDNEYDKHHRDNNDEICFETQDDDEDDDNDEDEEPLILLTHSSANKMRKKKKKLPRLQSCLQTCKHKCITKYAKSERIDIFNYYWNLSKEDKVNFIRQHIRKPVLTRIRNKKRGNNCRYFLKYYKIEGTNSKITARPTDTNNDNKTVEIDADDLTKVCRKFFEGTLGISNREIKEAIEGYELKLEKMIRPIRDMIKDDRETKLDDKSAEKIKKPQQFLDPETGNLTDTKPKKKTKRRKPGEPEPERFPRPINCAIRCTYKCHQNFTEEERKQICDIFWSLDFKRRKDFILARLETKDVKTPITPEFRKTNRPTRAYQSRFYLRSGLNSENKRVCKHFMMNTLCINRKFIENALQYADKTTGNYTGVDGRGKHLIHKISTERKQAILDHINSYPVWVPSKKAKIRCLHHTLSLKRMYNEYREKCNEDQIKPVSSYYYCKVFHDEFRLLFLSNKDSKKGRGFLDINPNISHYTGEEPGGCWLDSKGKPLDLRLINPSESLKSSHFEVLSCSSMETSSNNMNQSLVSTASGSHFNQSLSFATAAAAQHLANFVDTTTSVSAASATLHTRSIFQTTVQNLYDSSNLQHSNTTSSIFRIIEPDNDVEQSMGDSSKIPTEEEIDKSGELRSQAASAYSEQKFQEAIDLYTQAIEINPGNALFHAKRGQAFLKLKKPNACIRDCNKALEINCDSAAAYKFRGRANRLLGNWEEAAMDLRQACKLDFDEETDEWLREVTPNAKKIEQHRLKQQRKKVERERKEEELKRQKVRQQQAKQKSSAPPGASGFPGGFPSGMNMGDLMSGMKDPEVMAALQDIASNPANIEKYMSNPKIAKLVNVVKNSFPGGVPGFPGGFPGAGGGAGATTPPPSAKTDEPKETKKKPDFVDDGLD